MSIPDISREQIIEVLKVFDKKLRNTPQWTEWDKKFNFKYAVSSKTGFNR